jgi:hypothetical protein
MPLTNDAISLTCMHEPLTVYAFPYMTTKRRSTYKLMQARIFSSADLWFYHLYLLRMDAIIRSGVGDVCHSILLPDMCIFDFRSLRFHAKCPKVSHLVPFLGRGHLSLTPIPMGAIMAYPFGLVKAQGACQGRCMQ